MVFYAEAESHPFVDVEVITLKQRCLDLLMPEAIEFCADQNIDGDQDSLLSAFICSNNDPMSLCEFISVHYSRSLDKNFIQVGVNRDTVDDEAVDHALTLLSNMQQFTTETFVEFGPSYKFIPSQIQK